MVIIVFRIGSVIPVPFIDPSALKEMLTGESGLNAIIANLDMLSGGGFSTATLFAMSVSPYITASIVMQLLTVAIPPLERLSKEGDEGRKKIAKLTRYVTVILGIVQGTGYYFMLRNGQGIVKYTSGFSGIFVATIIVLSFTAGTALLMWLGEQVNKYGIGNGISILLFAGIVSRMPVTLSQLWKLFNDAINSPESSAQYFALVPLFLIVFLATVWIIVFMNDAERRIPIQYAKRMVGRKMYGGQNSHIPIKVGLTGVMPIIFASSILQIPSFVIQVSKMKEGFWFNFLKVFTPGEFVYGALMFLLIIMFAYFYVTIQYNPIEMANNLRQNNGTVPGIRPGKPTSDFIAKVLSKITLIGALFLGAIAIVPMIFGALDQGMKSISLGGTSIIILVGVALETVKQMESQLMMRHYKGFLD